MKIFFRTEDFGLTEAVLWKWGLRFVLLLGVVVPVVFPFFQGFEPSLTLPKKVSVRAADSHLLGVILRGHNVDGRYVLRARESLGRQKNHVRLRDVVLDYEDLKTPDTLSLEAGEAVLDRASERVHVFGGVRLRSGSGYEMETQGASVDLTQGAEVRSTHPVRGSGPAGTLHAARAFFGGKILKFEGGVRLLLRPPSPS